MDVGDTSPLKLTIQLTKTSAESGKQNATNIVNSVECSSIESGIDLFNSHTSRLINLSQCKAIVISEELAVSGIGKYITTLTDNVEMSPHANIIISKSTAEDFLNSSEPVLEDLASKYYDLTLTSNDFSGYTKNVSLIEFFSDYYDTFSEPVASLGSLRTNNNTTQLEIMGLTVFKKDKLVGELNVLETICHMIVSNSLSSCKLQVPNPFDINSSMDVEIRLKKASDNNVQFINNSPYITSNIDLQIKILSLGESIVSNNIDYTSKENIETLEESFSKYFSEQIYKYLYKTSKEYNCDIDGFGKYAVKYFSSSKDWSDYNWLDNYKNSFFSISVTSTIKSSYSFL